MKKLFTFLAASFAVCSFNAVHAQLQNGSVAPDWTLTDINGISHHLYSDLDSGYTVYIDVSATWCGPCWNYHNSGALDQLWAAHGPVNGPGVSAATTGDVKVYFIEGDGTTNSADLNGTGTNTQGNWVAGVYFPIIDPPAAIISGFNTNYSIAYFPTIYMICPDRVLTEVGQQNATGLYAAHGNCSIATTTSDVEVVTPLVYTTPLAMCDSVKPTFRLTNIGTDTLTSLTLTYKMDGVTQRVVNWTGSLPTYHYVTLSNINVGASSPGSHVITLVTSNPNGNLDPTSSNNTASVGCALYPSPAVSPITEDFETSGIPSTWGIVNQGTMNTWGNSNVGYSSTKSAKLTWFGSASGDNDYLYMDPQDFSSTASPVLTFEVAYCQISGNNDKLSVEVSLNCGTSWSPKYIRTGATLSTTTAHSASWTPTTTAEWRMETINLNTLGGMSNVWIRFKGTSDAGNNLYLDNINIAPSAIDENHLVTSMNIFPNPANDNSTINFGMKESGNVKIEITNELGQVISSEDLGTISSGDHYHELNTSSLNDGIYFISIVTSNGSTTQKLSVSH
ncbi:MAG: T9SS type A sorting domain-containing protein [Bacteroidetes bacterium]|nr:T9SS type A sorting domain-containing protein [Bacteroidota bacterium]